jgi:hypothetical protein
MHTKIATHGCCCSKRGRHTRHMCPEDMHAGGACCHPSALFMVATKLQNKASCGIHCAVPPLQQTLSPTPPPSPTNHHSGHTCDGCWHTQYSGSCSPGSSAVATAHAVILQCIIVCSSQRVRHHSSGRQRSAAHHCSMPPHLSLSSARPVPPVVVVSVAAVVARRPPQAAPRLPRYHRWGPGTG